MTIPHLTRPLASIGALLDVAMVSAELSAVNPDSIGIRVQDDRPVPPNPARSAGAKGGREVRVQVCSEIELATGRTLRLGLETEPLRYRPTFEQSPHFDRGYREVGGGRGMASPGFDLVNHNLPSESASARSTRSPRPLDPPHAANPPEHQFFGGAAR